MIWLLCSASIAVIGFWYPEAVANQNASPDDRFGFALTMAIPFEILGGIIALRAAYCLIASARQRPTGANQATLVAGLLLTAFSVSPLFIIGSRLLR